MVIELAKDIIVVGILPTYNLKNEDNDPYKDVASFIRMYEEVIEECGAVPVGILNKNVEIYTEICDAYVWPGGTYIRREFYPLLVDAIKNHKPFLGICMGMQAITTFFNILEDNKDGLTYEETYQKNKVDKPYIVSLDEDKKPLHLHYVTKDEESIKSAMHKIFIVDNTFMKEIYDTSSIFVPSMHGHTVARITNNLIVSARSEDNVIEAVEYHDNDSYILGVQYHPELVKDKKIFTWLVNKAHKKVSND